jgi:hypothetical protein
MYNPQRAVNSEQTRELEYYFLDDFFNNFNKNHPVKMQAFVSLKT